MTASESRFPVPGVAVIIMRMKDGAAEVVLGERYGERGKGLLAPVCGAIERGETALLAARRELIEEVYLLPSDIVGDVYDQLGYVEHIDDTHHFVGIVMAIAVTQEWRLQNMEPKKQRFGWFRLDHVERVPPATVYGGIGMLDQLLNALRAAK